MKNAKFAKESVTVITELVLPNDTNPLNNLMGGRLLHWMDIATAIAAQRHCKRIVVTACVNNVAFERPIPMGSIVTLEAKVSRAFSSSIEVFVDVWMEDRTSGKKSHCNQAIYTFVAVDQLGSPIHVPEVLPESEEEKNTLRRCLKKKTIEFDFSRKNETG